MKSPLHHYRFDIENMLNFGPLLRSLLEFEDRYGFVAWLEQIPEDILKKYVMDRSEMICEEIAACGMVIICYHDGSNDRVSFTEEEALEQMNRLFVSMCVELFARQGWIDVIYREVGWDLTSSGVTLVTDQADILRRMLNKFLPKK
jgi:hypothetical protein